MKQLNPFASIGIYTAPTTALTGATTCTISHDAINTSSIIEAFSQNTSGDVIGVTNIAVTAGQAVLTFDALTEDTSFILHITNI